MGPSTACSMVPPLGGCIFIKQDFKKGRNENMKTLNLQDTFLNQARREKIAVTIYLTNGFQFKGIVRGFDNFTVILDCDGKQNLVYKHAISTIIPTKPITMSQEDPSCAPAQGCGHE